MKKQYTDNEEFLSEKTLLLYKQGGLSNAEMRRVERLLEKYPLYADALEGFALLDDQQTEKNIAFLREKSQASIVKKPANVLMPSRQSNLMRIAAAITVLLVCSFGIYFVINNMNDMAVSQAVGDATPISQEEQPTSITEQPESVSSSEAQAKEEISVKKPITEPEERKKDEKTKQNSQEIVQNKDEMSLEKNTGGEINRSAEMDKAQSPATDQPGYAESKSKKTLQDSMQLARKEAVKPKNIDDGITEKSDSQSDNLKISSTVNNAPIAAPSKKAKNKEAQTQTEDLKLADGVMTDKDANFNSLLKQQLITFAKEKGESLKGRLVVSFTLNRKGFAKNIIIKESPCQSCESEAIRLIKAHQDWDKKPSEKRIEIGF